MQSMHWYFKRLQRMPADELMWRIKSLAVEVMDRLRQRLGRYPFTETICRYDNCSAAPGYRVTNVAVGAWASAEPGSMESHWRESLVLKANAIAEHRLGFFNLCEKYLGNPIDWNRDHENGKSAPLSFAQSIDYRDFRVTGDAKVVWEPNRHHQWVVLGKAYRATGDIKYAHAMRDQLDSWLEQCPFGRGMNWRSPLELGIRLINWVWAIDLIRESELFVGDFRARVLHALYLHLWEITRKYSRGSSANNHLIGEAAGVFVASSYFRDLPNTARWRQESYEILSREILEQTYPDGCTRELALGYHMFVVQFFIVAGVVARFTNHDFPLSYWSRLEKMVEFLAAIAEGGRDLPMFGDADDGHVLDFGIGWQGLSEILSIGSVLFHRSDFKAAAAEGYSPSANWLLGRSGQARFDALASPQAAQPLRSKAFPDSGHYLLQWGNRDSLDRVSVLFDCGELGFKTIAAHGHADALNFTLRAFGTDVFIDPGTYDYFSYPLFREHFRSTRAHNTVAVDDLDQSVMFGPFMWGRRAQAHCVHWKPTAHGGSVTGEHDGYTRLADPVVHRRTLELDHESRSLTIHDEIRAGNAHSLALYLHLSEFCELIDRGSNHYKISTPEGTLTLDMDPMLNVSVLRGTEEPIAGWVSRGYHQKVQSTTLIGRCTCRGGIALTCRIKIGESTGMSAPGVLA